MRSAAERLSADPPSFLRSVRNMIRFCLGLRLRFEKVARAENFSVAHDSTIDEPSCSAVLVLNLSYLRPMRPLLIRLYLGLSRWFRFHDARFGSILGSLGIADWNLLETRLGGEIRGDLSIWR
jgi:hypothetical protein